MQWLWLARNCQIQYFGHAENAREDHLKFEKIDFLRWSSRAFSAWPNVKYDNILPTINITLTLNSAMDVIFLCEHFDVWSGFQDVNRLFAILAF
jgi:hypothetical protein